ncbi:MAG: hypothetical protein CMF51_01525 [Legionellales bacterium]|nr:hypothetical protein [Legionellales bacterium]
MALRSMMGLSREMIRLRYGIARGTLQNWESARFGGLTEKGAKIILRAAQAEKIKCSLTWLLHGIGPEPQPYTTLDLSCARKNHTLMSEIEMQRISKMVNIFRQHTPLAIDFMIQDDCMSPLFKLGEYVAGHRHYQAAIQKTLEHYCIVQTAEHGTLLRYVKAGDEIGLYHLISINPHTTVKHPTRYNVEILSSAPVTFKHRVSPIQETGYLTPPQNNS